MKNRFFSLESFLGLHRSVLHPLQQTKLTGYDSNLNWQIQRAYEQGWLDCLDDLEKEANDTSVEDAFRLEIDKIVKEENESDQS